MTRLQPLLLALLVVSGCMVGDTDEADEIGAFYAGLPEVSCAGLKEWALNVSYPGGTLVTDTGDAFRSRYSHISFAPNWNPKNAGSIWIAVGHCQGGAAPPAPQPPAPPPPTNQPPPPPPSTPPGICSPDGRPGPRFDPAGAGNVGNGRGIQFIGGQCLNSRDCASGCCALPCGICSGPGAQFQNGKQGCGFGG